MKDHEKALYDLYSTWTAQLHTWVKTKLGRHVDCEFFPGSWQMAIYSGRAQDTNMQQELIRLLRAQPFVPFVIFTRDGEIQPVNNIERLVAGRNVCAYVDEQGYISLIPYTAIDRVLTKNGPELA